MKYEDRLNKLTEYIGQHIDDDISLDELSRVACFSKYHLHRLFTAMTGISLKQYVRWLRLKRAAHQLIAHKEMSILDIAVNAGFESHEAFSRAFKKECGVTPREFRQGESWSRWEGSPYKLQQQGDKNMKVDIRNVDNIRLAVVEHRGDPNLVAKSVDKLISWAKAQPINLKPKAGQAFAFGYDDPATTAPNDFRLDLALQVPENYKLDDEVVEGKIPAGRYAVVMHKGSRDNIGDSVYAVYRDWLPASGEEIGDLPAIMCYHNFDHEVAETELLTEVWFQLKD